jgi:hypothetical protein
MKVSWWNVLYISIGWRYVRRVEMIGTIRPVASLRYLLLDEGISCWVKSYAGSSVATGRVTLAGQVKGEHPDKERYPGPRGWGLGVLLANAHCKKTVAASVEGGYSGQMKGRQNRRFEMDNDVKIS